MRGHGRAGRRRHGYITCFLRDGDRVFLTYATTGRGNEPINGSFGMLDMTPYGRGEAWEDNPEGCPRGAARAGTGARTRTGTPPGVRPVALCRSGPARRDTRGDPRPAGHHH